MGTVVAAFSLIAERSSSRRVFLDERSLSRGGRFAVRFVETLFVALSIVGFAEDDSFRVDVG
jgi:hypothetical protein